MAQWDARDPRWVVEDLKDEGQNVGQWHWQERNVLPWARDDLAARLTSVSGSMGAGGGGVTVTKVASVEGEAYLTTRKGGKKFAAFELVIALDWAVTGEDGAPSTTSTGGTGRGTLKLSEVSASSVGAGGDPTDVLFEVGGDATAGTAAAALAALKPGILAALGAHAAALEEL